MSQPPRGPIRCPTCGLEALPHQSRCLHCNSRLNEALPVEEPPQVPPVVEERAAGILAVAPGEPDTYAFADKPAPEGRRCPGCRAPLDENAILCVQCGYDFRLGKSRTTVVEKPKKETRADRRRLLPSYFPQVLLGLTLHNARILLSLLATVLIVGLTAYAAAKRGVLPADHQAWFALALLAGVGIWLLSVACGFVGSILCLWLPDTPGRCILALALVLDLATLPLGVVSLLLDWTPLWCWAMGLGSWVLFMVFLARLAEYIERPSEAREAWTILIMGLILIAVPVVLGTLTALSRDPGAFGLAVAIFLPLSGILYLRVQFVLLRLLESLRASMRQQLDEARREEERRLAEDGAAP